MTWTEKSAEFEMPEKDSETARTSKSQITGIFLIVVMFGLAFWASGQPEGTLLQQWDKIVHTLSGAALALVFSKHIKSVFQMAILVFVIGALFEIAEYMVVPLGYYKEVDRYVIDTTLDLIVDVLGAIIMLQLIRLKQKHD